MNIMHGHIVPETSGDKLPVPQEVQEAVRTLLRWAGDDPEREGLIDTPARYGRAWKEYCAGYEEDPAVHLQRTFEEVAGYDEVVLLRDIPFHSHCEHHLAPIVGTASIAYLPTDRVVGISKLARVLHGFARRLQVQERLTNEIAECIRGTIDPLGVGVIMQGTHLCMAMRGIRKQGSTTTTTCFTGQFRNDPAEQVNFMTLLRFRRD